MTTYEMKLYKFYIIASLIVTALFLGVVLASADDIVAEVIAAEACSEGFDGMKAVANTIANRSKHQSKTPYQIVTAKNQYYGYTNKNRHKIYLSCKSEADYLSVHLMELSDLTDGAEFFLLPGEPVRKWHGKKTVTIGKHTFYRGR